MTDIPQQKFTGKRLRELLISEINTICMGFDSRQYGIPSGVTRDKIYELCHNILYEELRRAYHSDSQLGFMKWYEEEYADLPPMVKINPVTLPPPILNPPALKPGELPDWLTQDAPGI